MWAFSTDYTESNNNVLIMGSNDSEDTTAIVNSPSGYQRTSKLPCNYPYWAHLSSTAQTDKVIWQEVQTAAQLSSS